MSKKDVLFNTHLDKNSKNALLQAKHKLQVIEEDHNFLGGIFDAFKSKETQCGTEPSGHDSIYEEMDRELLGTGTAQYEADLKAYNDCINEVKSDREQTVEETGSTLSQVVSLGTDWFNSIKSGESTKPSGTLYDDGSYRVESGNKTSESNTKKLIYISVGVLVVVIVLYLLLKKK